MLLCLFLYSHIFDKKLHLTVIFLNYLKSDNNYALLFEC